MEDNGSRVKTSTGALREDPAMKGEWTFIPYEGMQRLAIWYELGAVKYSPRNWERGLSVRQCCNSIARHLWKFIWGWQDEDHLAAICWNAMAIMFYEAHHTGNLKVLDLPRYQKGDKNDT